MKKFLALLLAGLMTVSLAACGGSTAPAASGAASGGSASSAAPAQTSSIKVGAILIGDENEGYSKLISFLHQPSLDESTLSETLSSYISLFNLDPNRVFDMILDTCEFEKAKYPVFRPIFSTFKIEEIPHLLEFKMRYYKSLDVPPFFKFKRSRRAFPTRFSNFPRAFSATVSSNLLFSSVFLPTKKPPWRKPRKPAYFPALFLPRPIHSSPSPRERAS